MKKNILVLFIIILLNFTAYTQSSSCPGNIANNPGFENYIECPHYDVPNQETHFYLEQCVTDWFSNVYQMGSADYFHSCGDADHDYTPMFSSSTVNPPNGTPGYAGIRTCGDAAVWHEGPPPYTSDSREYMVGTCTPLIAGVSYEISVYIRQAKRDISSIVWINHIGIRMTVGAPTGANDYGVWSGGYLVGETNNTGVANETWAQISYTYVAVGGEDHIIFGNFYDNANTTQVPNGATGYSSPDAYCFFDDVCIMSDICSISDISINTQNCTITSTITGDITFANPPTTGTLTITDDISGLSATYNAPFTSQLTYSIANVPNDGLEHNLTASFSDDTNCHYTETYTAPTTSPVINITSGPNCEAGNATYSVNITVSAGTVTSTAGTVTNVSGNNWVISGVPSGVNITITTTDTVPCSTTIDIISPDCTNCDANAGTWD